MKLNVVLGTSVFFLFSTTQAQLAEPPAEYLPLTGGVLDGPLQINAGLDILGPLQINQGIKILKGGLQVEDHIEVKRNLLMSGGKISNVGSIEGMTSRLLLNSSVLDGAAGDSGSHQLSTYFAPGVIDEAPPSQVNFISRLDVGTDDKLSLTNLIGTRSMVTYDKSSEVKRLIGGMNSSFHSGSGKVGMASGTISQVQNQKGGEIDQAVAEDIIIQNSEDGKIFQAYGLKINLKTPIKDSIGQGYGIYIDQVQAQNSYGIYQSEKENPNFFAGAVGFGKKDPVYAVDVAGDIRAAGCLRTLKGASSGECASDERLKTDIRSFDFGLQEILQLKPRFFKYNGLAGHEASTEDEVGLIAQETEQAAPFMIGEQQVKLNQSDENNEKIKTVNYSSLPYLLINAVQELHRTFTEKFAQIDLMKQKLDFLEKENQELKKRLTALETSNQ